MRVFVLEDEIDQAPRNQILDALSSHKLTVATSFEEGKRKYKPPYDLLILDHDMRGLYGERDHPNTGYKFVEWLTKHHPKPKGRVILHSQYAEGRKRMRELLADFGWSAISEHPFSQAYVEFLTKEFA